MKARRDRPMTITTGIVRGETCYFAGVRGSDIRFSIAPEELGAFGLCAERLAHSAEVVLDAQGRRAFDAMLARYNSTRCAGRCGRVHAESEQQIYAAYHLEPIALDAYLVKKLRIGNTNID